MNPWSGTASSLEDTRSGTVLVTGEAAPNYFWPVWRFGRVLQPEGTERLSVEDAQEIGSLFLPGQPAALRYLSARVDTLRKEAGDAGGQYYRDWPEHLKPSSTALMELANTWRPEEILITYSFVPIIRFPRFIVEVGPDTWQVRESLTVCGFPSQSKAWVTASLVARHGKPTDEFALSMTQLASVRRAFKPFADSALASLVHYYVQVLNEDTLHLKLEKALHIRELGGVAGTEILSLASGVDLGKALEELEKRGLQHFRAEGGRLPGAREVLDFLKWTDSVEMPSHGEWRSGRPKILAIYADEPACGPVRALVMSRISVNDNRTWYAALAERRQPEKQPTCVPLSESAGRFLAKEYGRYF